MSGFTVAAVQMDAVLAESEANWGAAEALVAKAASERARIVVLPELFATGYRLDENYRMFAESVTGLTTARLAAWCKRYGLDIIVGSVVEVSPSPAALYNTAVVVGGDGLLGCYRKVNLWDQERLYFRHGSGLSICSTPLGRIGLLICYDLGFPEMARGLALLGADVLCVPAAFGAARLYAWDLSTRARALENGFFVVAANRVGQEKGTAFAGHSRIVAPDGSVLAEVAEGEGVALAEVDLEVMAVQRAALPYLRDLRPEFLTRTGRHLRHVGRRPPVSTHKGAGATSGRNPVGGA